MSLPELAALANSEHGLVVEHLSSALVHAIRAGEVLLQAREQVPTGQWMKWVRENVPDIAHVTASKYMRFATYRDELAGHEGLGVRAAAVLLRELPAVNGTRPGGDDEARREEARRLYGKEGLTLQQVADELGVGQSTVSRYVNPERTKRKQERNTARAQRERDQARRAAETEERKRRADLARKSKSGYADAYRQTRDSVVALERAYATTLDPFRKEQLRMAVSSARKAEAMVVAVMEGT